MAEKYYNVKNRSASRVCYTIPEDNIRRAFAPGEVKRLSYNELLKLSYQPGGSEMMVSFLQIQDDNALRGLSINPQPEYYMSETQIMELLKTGTMEAFLDCLDFAPVGVIDLVKKYAVSLPLSDYAKKKALKEKTGFDVDKIIDNLESEGNDVAATSASTVQSAAAPGRRTSVNYNATPATPQYKVVSKKTLEKNN